ncbi:MAG: PhoX family phosphatase [Pelagimonas sp.]|jgi:secreted PhoX family phosphatase|nr:PhoX family phosphatase [Pelagimonas sp.]
MDIKDTTDLSWDEFDELRDPRPEENDFDKVVDAALSRRGFLGGVLAFGSGAVAFGSGLMGSTTAARAATSAFPFEPIGTATDFDIRVPKGYAWKPLVKLGQPLFAAAEGAYGADGVIAADKATMVFGENTDGMESYVVDGKQLITVNSEYVNPKINLPAASEGVPQSAEEVKLLQSLQGVTVMEIADTGAGYDVVLDSPYNRRITHNTQMTMDGPVAGTDLVKTKADPAGMSPIGTMNNCGSGRTLWNTYLTCEENFNGYFGASDENHARSDAEKRYGIGTKGRYAYEKFDPRYDIVNEPNEPHRHGWITEIDPSDPTSTPVKHSALGRFKHENAAMVQAKDGRVVVYMGDDERGEFMYKYVSNGTWAEGQPTDGLLSEGTLYVAKFNDDMTGEWLALTPDSTGMTEVEILVYARMAGSKVGATTMDRPEWIACNPLKAEAYCALTNNKNRGLKTNAGGDETPVGGPNPREANKYGQIVRWIPEGDDHGATGFAWDLYVMAGNPNVHSDAYAGSDNVTPGNMFNSPDGMVFDSKGWLWIQTDGNYKNEGDFEGMGNNQMLVGNTETGEIARFMTVPYGAEVTGLCFSADRKVAFVGVQHPGGSWPDGEGKPRSSVVQVWREDGGTIG